MICQRMPAFGTLPIAYWLTLYIFCWVVLWFAVRRPLAYLKMGNPAFCVASLGLLFLLRLPSIVFDQEISPDESQMIAQALTLRQDPVYFRSVDGTTGGPLDSYLLVLPSFLGLPFDYITARLMAFGLIALSLLFLFATARLLFSTEAARMALVPVVALLGLTQNGDLLHYNSELVAVLLLSATYYLLARLWQQPQPSAGLLVGIGLLLGMVPFGKLQGAPLGTVVGLFAALAVLLSARLSIRKKVLSLGRLLAGALIFPLLFVALIWLNGVYDDFVTFYLLANFQYATGANPIQSLLALPRFFQKGDEFDWFVKLVLSVWVLCLVSVSKPIGRRQIAHPQMLVAFLVTLTLVTLYAITRTGSEYVHYLYFMIGPLFFWLTYGLATLRVQWLDSRWRGWLSTGPLAIYMVAFLVKNGLGYAEGKELNQYPTDHQSGWRMPLLPVSKKVLEYARPGEKLAVWGWRCDYYVQTQMVQGIAENHTIRSVFNHSLRDVYQRRYMRNLIRSFPPVFIDAVGHNDLWLTDRKTQGHELYPPLREFIAHHYQYMGMVDDSRIYVRIDRVPEQPDTSSRKLPLLVDQKHVAKKRTDI